MSALKNLGYIKEAMFFPCAEPSPTLVIEAAAAAGLVTLWSAATFSCLDIVKLRAGISPWHARGLKALVNGINSPAEQNKINGLYKFLIPVEQSLFFFFIVDLTIDFFANWQSQIFKLGGCTPHGGECSKSGNNPHATALPAPHGALLTYTETSSSGNCTGQIGNGFFVPPGSFFTAYFSATCEPIFQDQPLGYVNLVLLKHDFSDFYGPPTTTPAGWFGNSISASASRNGQNTKTQGAFYYFTINADNPFRVTSGNANWSVSTFPIKNDSIIPVNCFGVPTQSPL